MKNNIDYSLYLVTDRNILAGRDLCKAVEDAIVGGVTLVQLREKTANSFEFYKVATEVKKVTDKYNVPLIINDRIDIALAVDAAGVHIGQSDIPCEVARKIIGPNKILGVSTATLEEAMRAKDMGADYLGVGAMFVTTSKEDVRSVSKAELKAISINSNIPVVAIGGINENNLEELLPCNIQGFAVISAILGKPDVKRAAQHMISKICKKNVENEVKL